MHGVCAKGGAASPRTGADASGVNPLRSVVLEHAAAIIPAPMNAAATGMIELNRWNQELLESRMISLTFPEASWHPHALTGPQR